MLSMAMIALVLTVVSLFKLGLFTAHGFRVQIENNLDEWVTGEHVPVPFSQNTYEQKYLAHVKRLKDFDTRTKEANILPRIRRHLLKMARYVRYQLTKC